MQPFLYSNSMSAVTDAAFLDTTFLYSILHICYNCCKDRLAGFTLTAQSDSSTTTPYSYTDSGGSGQDSYTVVPSPRISFSVSLVRFVTAHSTNILSLCEVFVFGEQLPECEAGRYGADCSLSCSATCGGDNSCDRADGACSQGCDPGYTGTICATQCEAGKYGAGCTDTCSVHCAGSGDLCNHITGKCDSGCDPGYKWNKCIQECARGTLGEVCQNQCNSACTIFYLDAFIVKHFLSPNRLNVVSN
ncbi:hypothetical protein RRG08_063664 [Elysia crispata]|uniref:Uncharacterized protein n=1 Tax=Elysia crispata TaxID=231223 RepID=A0AAE0ZV06_9GAST|nr:hypothetical protein RRG08_063664 [Elysia crispata]